MMLNILKQGATSLGIYFKIFYSDDQRKGQGSTEYALILVPVALVTIAVVAVLGSSITNVYCSITETFTVVDGEPCYETLSQVGDGPTVLRAKFRDTKDGIFLRARTENCTGDLIVVDYGVMDVDGGRNNYSISIVTDTPLQSVTVGSEGCGWTTVSLE